MEFRPTREEQVFFAAIAVTTLLAAMLFAPAVGVPDLFGLKMEKAFEIVSSIQFILFVVAAPLPIALISLLSKKAEKMKAILLATSATVIALAIPNLIFAQFQQFLVLQVAYVISVPLMVGTASLKHAELKKWVAARATSSAFKKSLMLINISLIVLSAMYIMPQQEEFIENLETAFLEPVLEGQNLQGKVTDAVAESLVRSQQAQVEQITSMPTFTALGDSEDPNAVLFFQSLLLLREELYKPSFKELVKSQLESNRQEIDTKQLTQMAKNSIPGIKTMEQFIWVFFGLILIAGFSLVGNFIMVPLSMIYAALLQKLLPPKEAEPKSSN